MTDGDSSGKRINKIMEVVIHPEPQSAEDVKRFFGDPPDQVSYLSWSPTESISLGTLGRLNQLSTMSISSAFGHLAQRQGSLEEQMRLQQAQMQNRLQGVTWTGDSATSFITGTTAGL